MGQSVRDECLGLVVAVVNADVDAVPDATANERPVFVVVVVVAAIIIWHINDAVDHGRRDVR